MDIHNILEEEIKFDLSILSTVRVQGALGKKGLEF